MDTKTEKEQGGKNTYKGEWEAGIPYNKEDIIEYRGKLIRLKKISPYHQAEIKMEQNENIDDNLQQFTYREWFDRENELCLKMRKIINKIRKRIKKGEQFSKLAKRYIVLEKEVREARDIGNKISNEIESKPTVKTKEFLIHL